MNTRLFYILLPFVFICTVPSFAQKQKQVLGKITDSTGNPVQGVTIQLSIEGLKDTLQTVTDKKGSFSFTVSSPKFLIIATAAEFKDFTQQYKFNGAYNIFQLGDIVLIPHYKTLNNVEVNVAAIIVKEDTIEYKANLFKVKEDATVEDILKKLPGLEVNKNGTITAQGKPVYKIKLNGKDFFGNDLKMATRELPANIIDKIQVIDDYGDAAAKTGIKSDEPVKIINLQLKKDKSKGMFGNIAAGYGSSGTYQAKLVTNLFSDKTQISVFGKSNNINNGFVITGKNNTGMLSGGNTGITGANVSSGIPQNNSGIPDGITTTHGAGLNFRVDFGKQHSFYGSYNYTNRKTAGFREQYAQFIYPAGTYFNNQDYEFTNGGNNHHLSLNLEVYPDSMSYLKISPDIFFNNSNNLNYTDFSFLNNNQKTSEGFIKDSGKMRMPNIELQILYNRYFHKKGRNFSISFSPSYAQSNTETHRPSFTRLFNSPGTYRDSLQDQQLYQKNSGYTYGLSLSYTEPIFKGRYLDLTYRHDFSRSNNDQKVYSLDTGSTIYHFNAGLSNRFTNRYTGDNIGLSFRTVKKKYNYTLGISLMPVNLKNYSGEKDTADKRQRTLNVAPLARINYSFSRSKNLSISYRGTTRQPTSLQLQPVRDISNQQFQKEGNPELKPEFSHSVNLSYNSFNFATTSSIFSTLGFNTIQNKIVNNSILLDTSGAQLSRPQNLNGFYGVNGFYTYSKALNKNKYAVKLNGSFQYYHNAVLVNSEKVSGNNLFLTQGIEFTYKNDKWLEFGVEMLYTLTSVTNLITKANKSNSSSWTFSNNLTMNLPYNTVIKYDFEKIINLGFDEAINKDLNLLNITVEKKLLKKKSLYLSFAGYNILNQNFSLNRQVTGNSIMDTRTLQIARYFIFTFIYRWNKFGK